MKRPDCADTIAAISSPPGPSLRSIVRLSGPQAWALSMPLLTTEASPKPTAPFGFIAQWPGAARPVACQLQFWPEGRSYTGQELVEWHLAVPNPIAQKLLDQLIAAGARAAEPGEFSFRAFMSGRIDLTQAEAVAGLFQAVSPEQLQVALDQLAGGLATRLDRLRNRMLDLLAWLEATLDFVEESDVSPITRNLIGEELRGSAWELAQMAGQWHQRASGPGLERILLAGQPNAGKSTLFNALAGAAQALVSPVPGTTRDYLEATIRLAENREVTLVDTAGIGPARDSFDTHSQQLGQREQLLADLILVCSPADESAAEAEKLARQFPAEVPRLFVRTKADLEPLHAATASDEQSLKTIHLSAATGQGLEQLKRLICQELDTHADSAPHAVETTRARTRDALTDAAAALEHAAATVAKDGGDELVAMDLRTAVESLDIITGRDVTEETLDRVFSRFCIGK